MDAPIQVSPAEPRQRWRVVYSRSLDAPQLGQRDQLAAWEDALAAGDLPIAGLDRHPARARIVFAAPLGVGVPAERELADLFLTERRSIAEVRHALAGRLPPGHTLVDLHDVWLGAPALPGQVVAAEYRAEIIAPGSAALDRELLSDAASRLMAAASLPRARDRGGRMVKYDLRPLLADIDIRAVVGPAATARVVEGRICVRFDPERGAGRPEEVLAALAESAGVDLAFASLVRERVVLASGDVGGQGL
ncbi:MAG: DUF2344 domain-containing protein [Chloroflexota bacterium]